MFKEDLCKKYRSPQEGKRAVLNIFALFDCIWPNLWAKQFGYSSEENKKNKFDSTVSLWASTVQSFSDNVIEITLDNIKLGRSKFIDFPPNVLQFREMCALQKKKESPENSIFLEMEGMSPEKRAKNIKKLSRLVNEALTKKKLKKHTAPAEFTGRAV